MPHVTVRGIQESELTAMAKELKKVVFETAEVKEEYVKIFYSPIRRVDEPEEVMVDVYWMHRPQELCDKVAAAITAFMKERGKGFVQVTFTEFPGNLFYEDNVHF